MERSTARQRQILLVLLTSLVELVLFIWGRACNVTAAAAAAAARGSAPTHTHTHITCNNPLTPRHIYRECRERGTYSPWAEAYMQMHLGVKRSWRWQLVCQQHMSKMHSKRENQNENENENENVNLPHGNGV